MENEIWKDIPEYENRYQASNLGRIRSLDRSVKCKYNSIAIKKGIIIKQHINIRSGYCQVHLKVNQIDKLCAVHRLVWMAFNGPIPEGMQVNHLDENPRNNSLSNLNLMTPKENCNWGTIKERIVNTRTNRKRRNGKKTVLQFDLEGNLIKEWESTSEIQRCVGYHSSNISSCCLGKIKTSMGYIWKYL